ncbi:hypothetical protein [Kiloniella sp.]|uniref:hypothetical protein n=1 Tax=Kiloniella sp. TaxID=1938587 RepID=UPI003A913BCA
MQSEGINFSTEALWNRSKEIIREDYHKLDLLLHKLGSPKPCLIWNPEPENLPEDQLAYFLEWWNQARDNNFAASPDAVDPMELRLILGHLAVLDVLDGAKTLGIACMVLL